jgi:DNA-binding NarL/FixJ family response regulator
MLRRIFATVDAVESATLGEALQSLRGRRHFDIILLDLGLPDVEGTAGVSALIAAAPAIPVMVISGRQNPSDAKFAIAAGARGYVLKASSIRALKPALFLVLSGTSYVFCRRAPRARPANSWR